MILDPLRYENLNDLTMRLHQSLVRLRGKAFWISVCEENLHVVGQVLTEGRVEDIHSSDTDLDISSPPLGYMNYQKAAYYIQRIPRRRNKQGFCEQSAMILNEKICDEYIDNPPPMGRRGRGGILCTKEAGEMIEGTYPKAKEAVEMLETARFQINSIAFSRRYAFVKDDLGIIKIHHMMRPIGFLSSESGKPHIPDHFKADYFKESLTQEGLGL